MVTKHKVFISFQHQEKDELGGSTYRNAFENLFGDSIMGLETRAIHDGDIDPNLPESEIKREICENYIKDTEVTVVLIGPTTFTRKYIDWEVSASLRTRPDGYPSGILGLILPEHPYYLKEEIDPTSIPYRITDNLTTGFACLHHWTFQPNLIAKLIHQAAVKRKTYQYDDSRNLLNFNLDPTSKIHYQETKYVPLTHLPL